MEFALSGSTAYTVFYVLAYNGTTLSPNCTCAILSSLHARIAYTTRRLVEVPLPAAARSSATTIRWRQLSTPVFKGDSTWSLNYIIFSQTFSPPSSPLATLPFPADFAVSQKFGYVH